MAGTHQRSAETHLRSEGLQTAGDFQAEWFPAVGDIQAECFRTAAGIQAADNIQGAGGIQAAAAGSRMAGKAVGDNHTARTSPRTGGNRRSARRR